MLASFMNYTELYHKVPHLVPMLIRHVVAGEDSRILSLCCTSHRFDPKSFCDKGTKKTATILHEGCDTRAATTWDHFQRKHS